MDVKSQGRMAHPDKFRRAYILIKKGAVHFWSHPSSVRPSARRARVPEGTVRLVGNSFLNDKMKRKYLRIVDERVKRFVRRSE